MSEALEHIHNLIQSMKLQQAISLLNNEDRKSRMNKNYYDDEQRNYIVSLYMFYFNKMRQHDKVIEYSKRFNWDIQMEESFYPHFIQLELSAFIQLQKFEQAQDKMQGYLKEVDSPQMKFLLYGYLGLLYKEMKKYYLAIQNSQIALDQDYNEGGQWVLENITFSQLQIGKYEEALNNINEAIEQDGEHIFSLIVKSEALIQLGRISESVETLGLAKEIVEAKSQIEWIDNKFSEENMKLIDKILNAERNSNKIKNPEALTKFKNSIQQIVLQFTSKKKKVLEEINSSFSKSTLVIEQAKLKLEGFGKTEQFQEYNDGFLQQASLIFSKSQLIMSEGRLDEALNLTDLLSLIPFFGSILTNNFYDSQKIKLTSQAICEFGKTVGNFESLIQQILAKILNDQNYSKQILESQEQLLFGYNKLIKEVKDYVFFQKQQFVKIEFLQQTPTRVLGIKDCQELIGGYIVKGYLTQLQRDEAISKASIFVCSDESKRSLLIELAEIKASNNPSNQPQQGSGCFQKLLQSVEIDMIDYPKHTSYTKKQLKQAKKQQIILLEGFHNE